MKVKSSFGFENHKENMLILINELKKYNPPDFIVEYQPSFIMHSDEAKLKILQFLYELSRNDTQTIKVDRQIEDSSDNNSEIEFRRGGTQLRCSSSEQGHNLYRSQSPCVNSDQYTQNKEDLNNMREGSSSIKPLKPKRAWKGNIGQNLKSAGDQFHQNYPQINIENAKDVPNYPNLKIDEDRPIDRSKIISAKKPAKPPKGDFSSNKKTANISNPKKFRNSGDKQLSPVDHEDPNALTSPPRQDAYNNSNSYNQNTQQYQMGQFDDTNIGKLSPNYYNPYKQESPPSNHNYSNEEDLLIRDQIDEKLIAEKNYQQNELTAEDGYAEALRKIDNSLAIAEQEMRETQNSRSYQTHKKPVLSGPGIAKLQLDESMADHWNKNIAGTDDDKPKRNSRSYSTGQKYISNNEQMPSGLPRYELQGDCFDNNQQINMENYDRSNNALEQDKAVNYNDLKAFEKGNSSKIKKEGQAPRIPSAVSLQTQKKVAPEPKNASRNSSLNNFRYQRPMNPNDSPKTDVDYENLTNLYKKKLVKDDETITGRAELETQCDIIVDPISEATVKKLMKWLVEISLIKEMPGIERKQPLICKNGELYFDLINRLEREPAVKGFHRNSKKKSEIRANYAKIFKHLSAYEKFNPRYFNSTYYLMSGHDKVFWGFLDDIYMCYNAKISKYDRRYQNPITDGNNQTKKDSCKLFDTTNNHNTSHIAISYNHENVNERSPARTRKSSLNTKKSTKVAFSNNNNFRNDQEEIQQPCNQDVTPTKPNQDYSQINNNKISFDRNSRNYVQENNNDISDINCQSKMSLKHSHSGYHNQYTKRTYKDLTTAGRTFFNIEENSQCPNRRSISPKSILKPMGNAKGNITNSILDSTAMQHQKNNRFVTIEANESIVHRKADMNNLADLQKIMLSWFETLGIKPKNQDLDKSSQFKDQIRNGYFLCLIVSKIYGKIIQNVCKYPNSIQECASNIEQALNILRENPENLPYDLLWKKEHILKGDGTVIYPLFQALKDKYDMSLYGITRTNLEYFGEEPKCFVNSTTLNSLPYSSDEILTLKNSTITWLLQIGVFNGLLNFIPTSIEEIMDFLKNGTIFIKLCNVVFKTELKGIHRKPISYPNFVNNIRRVQDLQKKEKRMGHKFLWKVKDIVEGNELVILGLLEDIHRLADGLPPRKDPSYFSSGPYFGGYQEIAENDQLFGNDQLLRASNQFANKTNDLENAAIINFKKDATSTTDYHMTLKSTFKAPIETTKETFHDKKSKINEGSATKSSAGGYNHGQQYLQSSYKKAQNSELGGFNFLKDRMNSGDKFRNCLSETGNEDKYNEFIARKNFGISSPMTQYISHQPQKSLINHTHDLNQQASSSLIVKCDDNLQRFSNLETQLPQRGNFGTFKIRPEEEVQRQQNQEDTIEVDTLKISVELLLIADQPKIVEETDWTGATWLTFQNGQFFCKIKKQGCIGKIG